MVRTWNLANGFITAALASTAALAVCATAGADPAAPPPLPSQQLPGLPAMTELSPIIQQAASNPDQASQLLMAAASIFSHNPSAPDSSKSIASSVNQFVAEPAGPGSTAPVAGVTQPAPGPDAPAPGAAPVAGPTPHVPAAGVQPGTQTHLPPGINPAHAAGPAPAAMPAAAPTSPAAGVNQPAAVPGPPAPHVPPASVQPGTQAHLPPGIDPAHSAGPAAAPAPPAGPAPIAEPAANPGDGAVAAPVVTASPALEPAPAAEPAAAPGFGPDTTTTQDFLYPSISPGCLSDGGNSIATALSVAGPAKIPTPGPGPGQTAYVFTAVGTSGPADVQKLPLNVTWVNLTTGKSGSAALKPHPDINPDGPTTLTAIVDTGSGSIMSTIFGEVTTKDKQCQFMPTIGSTVVP